MRSAVLLFAAACGSGAVSQAAFPDAFAEAVCEVQAKCRQQAHYEEQQCEEDAKSLIAPDLDKAVKAGKAAFVPSEAQACLDGLRARGCDLYAPDVAACKRAVKGTLPPGAACSWLYECAAGTCAPDVAGSCPASCKAVSGEGGPCDPGCDDRLGMRCIDNVCSRLHTVDQKCGGDSDCAAGLYCDGFGKCAERAFLQAVCETDHMCADGLWCDRSAEGGLCRAQIATGEPCTASSAEAILNACVTGDVCKGFTFAKTGATAGTCTPTGEVGAGCVASAQVTGCGEGLVCIGGKCAEKPAGGPCTGGADCKDGVAYCDGAQCHLLKEAGETCGSDIECASRRCDPATGKCVEVDALCHEP
ncbi:MAG: hypothetical protein LC689_15215 [Myxococcales bacterium]|nr:hypothetical protein [Myxococcales bacterium]